MPANGNRDVAGGAWIQYRDRVARDFKIAPPFRVNAGSPDQ
jgi:hypothetical protein